MSVVDENAVETRETGGVSIMLVLAIVLGLVGHYGVANYVNVAPSSLQAEPAAIMPAGVETLDWRGNSAALR